MKIRIYTISKVERDSYTDICAHFTKLSRSFGVELEMVDVFNKSIANAQKSTNSGESKREYSMALEKYIANGHNIALTPEGKLLDSYQFADIFNSRSEINFFIGGAYGFEERFLLGCHQCISLSPLTMGHKIAKAVLAEQIYRALSIINNHPYHK
ncbi:MAG: 23S rRNA (pseudouridine(1915)-N(3))-methyltransferase RlmH [Wolinella sp.]